jgi:hypothetical protein
MDMAFLPKSLLGLPVTGGILSVDQEIAVRVGSIIEWGQL